MPSSKKKSPASSAKKKTLSAAKAKSSMKKSTKKNNATTKNDGSYLQVAPQLSSQEVVSTASNITTQDPTQGDFSQSTGQAILQMLHKLDASNQALTKRMDSLERQNSVSSTPIGSPTAQRLGAAPVAHTQQPRVDFSTNHAGTVTSQAMTTMLPSTSDRMSVPSVSYAQPAHGGGEVRTQLSHDAVIPKPDVMRSIPSVSSAVTRLLAQYEDQADQQVFPGKNHNIRKRSGCYNTTDTSMMSPQYRWPNEGLVSSSHNKKPPYEELNMAQWTSGQLNNMLLVEDNTILRCMLTQMSLAMRDAGSLPWPAVRSSWAVSMTDIEEGRLQWSDSLQWSLNRISSSQLAVLNSTSVNPSGQKSKICRFYNEGNCNNESHHGVYKHFCNTCYKQGRSLMHPELKCSSRGPGRTQELRQNVTK